MLEHAAKDKRESPETTAHSCQLVISWPSTVGNWGIAIGRCRSTASSWQVTAGGWRLTAGAGLGESRALRKPLSHQQHTAGISSACAPAFGLRAPQKFRRIICAPKNCRLLPPSLSITARGPHCACLCTPTRRGSLCALVSWGPNPFAYATPPGLRSPSGATPSVPAAFQVWASPLGNPPEHECQCDPAAASPCPQTSTGAEAQRWAWGWGRAVHERGHGYSRANQSQNSPFRGNRVPFEGSVPHGSPRTWFVLALSPNDDLSLRKAWGAFTAAY